MPDRGMDAELSSYSLVKVIWRSMVFATCSSLPINSDIFAASAAYSFEISRYPFNARELVPDVMPGYARQDIELLVCLPDCCLFLPAFSDVADYGRCPGYDPLIVLYRGDYQGHVNNPPVFCHAFRFKIADRLPCPVLARIMGISSRSPGGTKIEIGLPMASLAV